MACRQSSRPLMGGALLLVIVMVQLLSNTNCLSNSQTSASIQLDANNNDNNNNNNNKIIHQDQQQLVVNACLASEPQDEPEHQDEKSPPPQVIGSQLTADTSSCQALAKQTNESLPSTGCLASDGLHEHQHHDDVSILSPMMAGHLLNRRRHGGRSAAAWRYDYFQEQTDEFQLLIKEPTFDERLANILFTVEINRIAENDIFDFDSGNKQEDLANMAISAGPQVDEAKCSRHLEAMLQLMDELSLRLELKRNHSIGALNLEEQHYRLAKVLDSFGRYGSGHLLGRTHVMGSFAGCSGSAMLLKKLNHDDHVDAGGGSQNSKDTQFEVVKARYCWARLSLEKHLNKELKFMDLSESQGRKQSLLSAICIPESCHTISFERNKKLFQRLVNSQFKLPQSIYLDESLELNSITCLADPDSAYQIPFSGRLLMVLLAAWFALILMATYVINYTMTTTSTSNSNSDNSGKLEGQQTWPIIDRYRPTLKCLDLRASLEEFLCQDCDDTKRARANLNAMNPLKVFGCMFVVFGHSIILQNGIPMDMIKALKQNEADPVLFGTIFGTLVVDTFFIITGILFSYIVMQKVYQDKQRRERLKLKHQDSIHANDSQQPPPITSGPTSCDNNSASINNSVTSELAPSTNGQGCGCGGDQNQLAKSATTPRGGGLSNSLSGRFLKQWFKFTATRFLRLLPLFYLVFWFKKSISIYLFAGKSQLWDEGHNRFTNSGSCKRESWLSPLLFGPAFLPLNRQCLPQGWSVSVDLFFSLTVAPILILMTQKPRLAFILGLILSLISSLSAYYKYSLVDENLTAELNQLNVAGFAPMFGQLSHLYTIPYYRFCSIVAGMSAGYALFHYERNDNLKHWPQWLRGWATHSAIATLVVSLLCAVSIGQVKQIVSPQVIPMVVSHLFSTYRIVWAICNAVVLLRLVTDWKDHYLVRLGSGKFWQILVKLNFAILLIHMDFLQFELFLRTPDEYNRFAVYTSFAGCYMFCLAIGSLIHLAIENPINKLIRLHVLPGLRKLCD